MQSLKSLLKWLPAILAVLSVVAEITLNLFGSNTNLVLYIVVGLLVIQIAILTIELESIKNARPKIEIFAPPYMDTRALLHGEVVRGQPVTATPLNCFHVTFANNPKLRVEAATARKVIAKLTYYDESGRNLIGTIYGRWGDTEQPGTRPPLTPIRDLLSVDLESSGLNRELDLAINHPGESIIYAFNNDSYPYPDWKKPEWAINAARILIHVRLSGENVDDTDFWMLLECGGETWSINLTVPPDLPISPSRDQKGLRITPILQRDVEG